MREDRWRLLPSPPPSFVIALPRLLRKVWHHMHSSPTNNVPSSATLSRAYTTLNKNKKPFTPPWHHRRLQQQQRNLISTSSLYDGTNNPSNDRERIGNENIFFIEVGFGNDSHGQVKVFNAHLYIACFPIIPCVLKKMSYIICTPSCFLSLHTHSMITLYQ